MQPLMLRGNCTCTITTRRHKKELLACHHTPGSNGVKVSRSGQLKQVQCGAVAVCTRHVHGSCTWWRDSYPSASSTARLPCSCEGTSPMSVATAMRARGARPFAVQDSLTWAGKGWGGLGMHKYGFADVAAASSFVNDTQLEKRSARGSAVAGSSCSACMAGCMDACKHFTYLVQRSIHVIECIQVALCARAGICVKVEVNGMQGWCELGQTTQVKAARLISCIQRRHLASRNDVQI